MPKTQQNEMDRAPVEDWMKWRRDVAFRGPWDRAAQAGARAYFHRNPGAYANVIDNLQSVLGKRLSHAEIEALLNEMLDSATANQIATLSGIKGAGEELTQRELNTIQALLGQLPNSPATVAARRGLQEAIRTGAVRIVR